MNPPGGNTSKPSAAGRDTAGGTSPIFFVSKNPPCKENDHPILPIMLTFPVVAILVAFAVIFILKVLGWDEKP
jgi:hypothetical protein